MTGMITFEIIPSMQSLGGESAVILALKSDTLIFWNPRDDSEGKRVKLVCAFSDERTGKNRSITDVDWSPKVLGVYIIWTQTLRCVNAVPRTQCCIIQQKPCCIK